MSGRLSLAWHVKHVTRLRPPKNIWLILFVITTIDRAIWIRGVGIANASSVAAVAICSE